MKERFLRWCCGGVDTSFFVNNAEYIQFHNAKLTSIFLKMCVAFCVAYSVICYCFYPTGFAPSILVAATFLICLYLFFRRFGKMSSRLTNVYVQVFAVSMAMFLLHYNFYNYEGVSVVIPLFLMIISLVYIMPMQRIAVFIFLVFAILFTSTLVLKPQFLFYDTVDCIIGAGFGLVLGRSVLKSRVNEIILINRIKAESKLKDEKIDIAMDLANTDVLTGVKNKTAYTQAEERINSQLKANEELEFAIVVCDINKLKTTNDLYGHVAGDELICSVTKMICDTFKRSPVYRIGGDEFVVILWDTDYNNRGILFKEMTTRILDNVKKGGPTFAAGMSAYASYKDEAIKDVFKRADEAMYKDKEKLHELMVLNENH